MKQVTAAVVVLAVVASTCQGLSMRHGRPAGGMLRDPPAERDMPTPPAQWFQQNLDHFDPQNHLTWKQRYFVNSTFYKPGGPVFLQIGGEGTANPVWVVVGQMLVQAQKHGALAVLLEHRYYGESRPTADLSTENLRYLSSEQALADLANFRDVYGHENDLAAAKWVTFGGSYPGSLSAWARTKYPHFFHAAVASSAPVWAELNFTQYLEVVQASLLKDGGPDCVDAVRAGAVAVNEMLETTTGRTQLKDIFNTCKPISTAQLEISSFSQAIAGLFMGVVQYNRDNVGFEGRSLVTITDVCNIMTNKSIDLPVNRLAAVRAFQLKTSSAPPTTCFDVSYADSITSLKNITYAAAEGGRQWFYQVCHEFGYLQSSQGNSTVQPFGNLFDVGTQVQQCMDVFDVDSEMLTDSIAWTNRNYGGLYVRGSRIVFPNGNVDPWHALSVLPTTLDLSKNILPVLIDGTAHCANMYPSRQDDMPSLVEARLAIANEVELYLDMDD